MELRLLSQAINPVRHGMHDFQVTTKGNRIVYAGLASARAFKYR
jgi:fumarate reductase subunit D